MAGLSLLDQTGVSSIGTDGVLSWSADRVAALAFNATGSSLYHIDIELNAVLHTFTRLLTLYEKLTKEGFLAKQCKSTDAVDLCTRVYNPLLAAIDSIIPLYSDMLALKDLVLGGLRGCALSQDGAPFIRVSWQVYGMVMIVKTHSDGLEAFMMKVRVLRESAGEVLEAAGLDD